MDYNTAIKIVSDNDNFSDEDAKAVSRFMCELLHEHKVAEVFKIWATAQKNINVLFKIHPYTSALMIYAAYAFYNGEAGGVMQYIVNTEFINNVPIPTWKELNSASYWRELDENITRYVLQPKNHPPTQ